jgi:hypothetical protein
MAFSSGTYTLPGPALVTGGTVSSTENNTFRNDVAASFNKTLLRDGTASASANIPMGSFKLTGLGVATNSGDALSYGQAATVSDLSVTNAITGSSTITGTKLIPTGTSVTGNGMYLPAANTLGFSTNGTEQARIDSSGNLLVGTTSAFARLGVYGSNTDIQRIYSTLASSASYTFISMFSDGATPSAPTGTLRVNIVTNGGIQNYSANNVNLSDRREKTNFAPATSYLEKICAIPVQTFNYIDQNLEEDGGLTLGVVAQDVQAVAPELVTESNWASKDEEPKMRLSIYQTDLQYALMKCIQEQQALITQQAAALTTLTERITALENA